jgi:hypothetical protein
MDPHDSPHAEEQLLATHAPSADTAESLPIARRLSTVHCDRHCGSPEHPERQLSYALHGLLPSHAFDSAQQLDCTHEAQDAVP